MLVFEDAKRSPTYADLSFALSFSDHGHFTHAVDLCGRNMLHVTDTVIGEEQALVFWDLPGFLIVANIAFQEKWSVPLHLVHNNVHFLTDTMDTLHFSGPIWRTLSS